MERIAIIGSSGNTAQKMIEALNELGTVAELTSEAMVLSCRSNDPWTLSPSMFHTRPAGRRRSQRRANGYQWNK